METRVDLCRAAAQIEGERARFDRFCSLLTEYNGKFNLTAVTGPKDIYYKHFLDSLAGEPLLPKGARVVEVGSGAGFPSIPLAIVRGDLRFTMIESVKKKCVFLKAAAEELGIKAEVLPDRAEEVARGPLRESFDVCVARAVARLNTLAEYCLPLVRVGGSFLAYKGEAEEELAEAQNAIRLLGGRVEQTISFELPENYGKRTLISVRKVRPVPAAYPRGRGKERKEPIL